MRVPIYRQLHRQALRDAAFDIFEMCVADAVIHRESFITRNWQPYAKAIAMQRYGRFVASGCETVDEFQELQNKNLV